jgi:hypothetical protein
MDSLKPEQHTVRDRAQVAAVHPAWITLIRHCQAMGHGEIERIKIQDGVPVLIEKSVEKIKLT